MEKRYFSSPPCMSLERRSEETSSKVIFRVSGLSFRASKIPSGRLLDILRKLNSWSARIPFPQFSWAWMVSLFPSSSKAVMRYFSTSHMGGGRPSSRLWFLRLGSKDASYRKRFSFGPVPFPVAGSGLPTLTGIWVRALICSPRSWVIFPIAFPVSAWDKRVHNLLIRFLDKNPSNFTTNIVL